MEINSKTYNRFTIEANVAQYVGPAHDLSNSDIVSLRRNLPTYNSPTDRGVLKTFVKSTRTLTTNSETGAKRPAIIETSFSMPVGATAQDVDALVADHAAWIRDTIVSRLARTGDLFQD